jgi:hypothetical protein
MWAGCCIIIIKKPRNLAEKSRMILWLEVDGTCARTTKMEKPGPDLRYCARVCAPQQSARPLCQITDSASRGYREGR